MFLGAIFVSLLGSTLCAVTSEDCAALNDPLPFPAFMLEDGSSLSVCTFNGQQCCSEQTLNLFNTFIRPAINNDVFDFDGAFAGARDAVNQLNGETRAILADITDDFIRPLFRSAIPSNLVTSDFNASVDVTLLDIFNALNGSNVNLTRTLLDYFLAVSNVYLDEVISVFSSVLSGAQRNCGVRAVFRHIYTNSNASAELVDLFQNISQAIRIIKRLPTLFEKLLNNINDFRFSSTCADVFLSNVLCPFCHNQPFMCPGRCTEVFIGCVSPLSQSIAQLRISFRLIVSIVESLVGSGNRVTNSVNVNRVKILFNLLVADVQNINFLSLDFARTLLSECGVPIPGKRSLIAEYHPTQHKRDTLDIPDVSLNQTLFGTLEESFFQLRNDGLLGGIGEFCSPGNRIEVSGFSLSITSPNGMCSYGIGNVGTYNSSFISTEIADQVFNNPAGRFDYEQLVEQAMGQTYIVSDLFVEDSGIPESEFSTYLPNDTMPTTEFLSAPPPTAPPSTAPPSTAPPSTAPSTNPGGVGGGSALLAFSWLLMAMLSCSTLALLL